MIRGEYGGSLVNEEMRGSMAGAKIVFQVADSKYNAAKERPTFP